MEDGSIQHFENIPESAKATVEGKQLGIHDLKPGMKLQRTITATTTPRIATTVATVSGTCHSTTPRDLDSGKRHESVVQDPEGSEI
jgi:hypothetical protein